ncbi:MAG: hypothetical protein GX681_03105 [Clostridiaceae bacterium]|jgi:hypothetical protein|nr:hypothetical protein [Clostridiaceae bacterium]
MTNQTVIAADLQSAYEYHLRKPQKEVGVYLISSNRELLNHMEKLMNSHGVFGVMDSYGRVHYILDARKGISFAENKLHETVSTLLEDQSSEQVNYQLETQKLVSQVLSRYDFNQKLHGYRVLSTMLELSLNDYSLLNPISKRLYIQVAKVFRVTAAQAERNVRYLLKNLAAREQEARRNGTVEGKAFLSAPDQRLPVAETVVRLWDICRLEAKIDTMGAGKTS